MKKLSKEILKNVSGGLLPTLDVIVQTNDNKFSNSKVVRLSFLTPISRSNFIDWAKDKPIKILRENWFMNKITAKINAYINGYLTNISPSDIKKHIK